MTCNKEFDECCKTGNLKKMVTLKENINIVSYTKHCIIAMENEHYDIVNYLLDIPNHNVYIDAKDHYLIKEACKRNLVEIVKKIICTTKNKLTPEQMISIAFKNGSLDVVLFLIQLFSVFPSYVSKIFCMACENNHLELIKFFQQQYKNFYFDEETGEIIIYKPMLCKRNIIHNIQQRC